MDEEESYAHFYLRKQGVERLDVLTFISHGLDEGPGSRGVEAGAESGENGEAKADPLAQYTVELTARAREGKIDPLVGRVTELDRAVEVLCRRRKNNPLFVGDPGVGKTALAEGLALRIVEGNVPDMGGVMLPRAVFQAELARALAPQTQTGAAQNCATPEMAGSGLPFPWLPWGLVYSYYPAEGFWAARS